MPSSLPGELLSIPGVASELLSLAREMTVFQRDDCESRLRSTGCRSPEAVFEELRAAGFFAGRPLGLAVTTYGYRSLLFVSGALGEASDRVFDELRVIEPTLRRYELVREGMTSRFIKSLLTEPSFQRLYLCSPWINLQNDDFGRLAVAWDKARRSLARPPELLVLVQTPAKPEVRESLERLKGRLKAFDAQIVEKPRLHSKLYIREPGPSGGLWLAIVGSENLTRQKWIELGIEIRNDSYILSRLRNYFFEISGRRGGE